MCGLVAIISKRKNGIYHSDMKVFTEMLFADQLRGSDGTGIIYNVKEKVRTLKGAIASSDFVNSETYDKAVAEIVKDGTFVVGHNRAATKGKLVHANTHPFREGHITLVHNGTLSYHKNLADVEVDSHAICISMAKHGAKKTIKEINGAFALIWTDSKQKTINFIRNSQRPLYIVETQYFFILVSEDKLAEWILDRNAQAVISVKPVPIGVLHQFEFSDLTKYHTETVEMYTPSFTPFKYTPPALLETKTVTTDPRVGDKIKFIGVTVDKDNKSKIIGDWEDSVTGECFEVHFWANNKEHADDLLKDDAILEGFVSHIAFRSADKSRYFVMRSAYKVTVPLALKSKNNIELTAKDIDNLEPKCASCNTMLTKDYLKEHIDECLVHVHQTKAAEYTCPDCTAWLEQWDNQNITIYNH